MKNQGRRSPVPLDMVGQVQSADKHGVKGLTTIIWFGGDLMYHAGARRDIKMHNRLPIGEDRSKSNDPSSNWYGSVCQRAGNHGVE